MMRIGLGASWKERSECISAYIDSSLVLDLVYLASIKRQSRDL